MKMAMERNYPILQTICPMAGTTAPFSMAGTALIANIEMLIPVIVSQLYKPGHPVIFGTGGSSVTEMKSGHDLYYRAEKMNYKVVGIQMGKFYGLPISGEAGGTLTHRADVQNGAESFAYLLSAFSGGQNIIGGLGSMYNANGMSSEQIIMQCGLADMAEYVTKGVDMSDIDRAVDSIKNIGPGGNFLADDFTLDQLHSDEFFESSFLDLTGGYEGDAPGMYEIAHNKANELVDNFKTAVPQKVSQALREFFQKKYTLKESANIGW
jgi:trimethylamine---corrinoid protein Co-methyltransferase